MKNKRFLITAIIFAFYSINPMTNLDEVLEMEEEEKHFATLTENHTKYCLHLEPVHQLPFTH